MATSNVSLKLLIDTKSSRVLYAEAGKDFVDFLFSLLHLPVGTVIRLLIKDSMVGSLGDLYESIENLSETYWQPNQNKDSLLKPQTPSCASGVPKLLPSDISTGEVIYTFSTNEVSAGKGGFVQGVVTYMVMDDLVVKPMSGISGITLLNKFNVKDLSALEERVVDFGMDEGLKLLKASLQTKTVLTSIFLGNTGVKVE
ncbi:Mitochondrial distribution and morphology protein [Actinidia chinensis var. chinensis]|uniref:Mitochondrial distribution and morphology protein n=1 Tax=Actinidia chinensis var. chinensis TaxID=1590841 RepID=A0A2R6RRF6_ACTCC|nr:Mitochondrial distribution and morphology protein [Actinidia chinensis var. chinensis]